MFDFIKLNEIQIALETSAVEEGVARYRKAIENKEGESLAALTQMRHLLTPVEDALYRSVKDGSTQALVYLKFLNMLHISTFAFIGLNVVFNNLNETETKIKVAIGRAVEDELHVQAWREGYGAENGSREGLLRYIVDKMNERQSKANRRLYLNKSLTHVEVEDGFVWAKFNQTTLVKLGGVILEAVLAQTDAFQVVMRAERRHGTLQTIRYVEPTVALLNNLEQYHQAHSLMRPMYGPMVVPPANWGAHVNEKTGALEITGGYLTKQLTLIKSANQNYLMDALESGALNNTFKAMNRLQNTAWKINTGVLEVVKALFEANSQLAGLPDHAELPKPQQPFGAEGRVKEFKMEHPEEWSAWKRKAAQYYAHRNSPERLGKIYEVNAKLNSATEFSQFKEIFFVYQMDFRGRLYPVSTVLSPQGDDLSHGLLTFAEGKPLSARGAKWLAVHGANCWALSSTKNGRVADEWMFKKFGDGSPGLDKTSFDTREAWVRDHEFQILASARDPLNFTFWTRADSPWQFLAFCFEYAGWKEQGEQFITHLPIKADGSCNGIQHYAAMLRDEAEGAAVNLVPQSQPADIYAYVAAAAAETVMKDAVEGTQNFIDEVCDADGAVKRPAVQLKAIAALFQGHINRKFVKRAVMTTPYGVSAYGVRQQLAVEQEEFFAELDRKVQPLALSYAARVVNSSIGSAVSSATKGMKFLQGVAKVAAKEGLPLVFSTFDGFPVQVAHRKFSVQRIRTTLSGGLNRKLNATSRFREELLRGLSGFAEQLVWTVMAILDYETVHGNLTDPDFIGICRELLTNEFDGEEGDKVVAHVMNILCQLIPEYRVGSVVKGDDDEVTINYTLAQETDKLDELKQARAIGPHFVHAADACHLRMTVNALDDMGIRSFAAVHDSYAVHATDYDTMSKVLREQFVRMHESDLLRKFKDEIAEIIPDDTRDKLPQVPTKGSLDLSQVLESDYFFA